MATRQFVFGKVLINMLFLIVSTPTFSQNIFNLMGIWEGKYTETTVKGEIKGRCVLNLIRIDKDVIVSEIELFDSASGKRFAQAAVNLNFGYSDGILSLSFPAAGTYFKSGKKIDGAVNLGLRVDNRGQRILEGRFVAGNPSPSEQHSTSFFELESKSDVSTDKWKSAGIVSTDVRYIDATEMSDFYEGYAVIRKGENFAMIDSKGAFFIPYGKYKFNLAGGHTIDFEKCHFVNGMCIVRDVDTERAGFINLKGELVIPCTLSNVSPFLKDGYGWGIEKNKEGKDVQIYINKKGEKFLINSPWWTGVAPEFEYFYVTPTEAGFNKFYTKDGKFLFKTRKKVHKIYNEGMIRVDSTYEGIGDKIGFIDSTGRMVVPYTFKAYNTSMGPFSEGLALYTPPVKDEYLHTFIDKKGEPVIRIRRSDKIQNVSFANTKGNNNISFTNGHVWAYLNNRDLAIMDRTGHFEIMTNLIDSKNPDFTSKVKKFKSEFEIRKNYVRPDMIIFRSNYQLDVAKTNNPGGLDAGHKQKMMGLESLNGYGLSDLSGNFILPPVYSYLSFMERKSGLARASMKNPKDDKTILDGYVDKTGAFVMIAKISQE